MSDCKYSGVLESPGKFPAPPWRVGLYIRLSKEDVSLARGRDDSNSVAHQRALLEDYCRRNPEEFQLPLPPYVDDGFTGTDTNREAFQRLLGDIDTGKINCVLVKDLSRLSRNYADAGSLIEHRFARAGVRFISLGEEIDSHRNPDSISNLLVPITNVLNDHFCYQTSQKIRQVFDYKRRSGAFIGGFAAYGYRKDPENKNVLLIDPEAAGVVGEIYRWFLAGMSRSAIVRRLNDRGVLCPSRYKQSQGLRYQNPQGGAQSLWSGKTVTDILKNRLYLGEMVQGRQRVKSYKIHTQIQVPREEWVVVPGTHPPIVTQEDFDRVQRLLGRTTRTPGRNGEPYLFSGLLRCGDCGGAMSRSRVKDRIYYFCRTYKDRSRMVCTKHTLRHPQLETAVLQAIRMQLYLGVDYPRALEELAASSPPDSAAPGLEGQLAAKERERVRLLSYRQALYQDWKDGFITQEDFSHMGEGYQRQLISLSQALEHLEAQHRAALALQGGDPEPPYQGDFEALGTVEKLTRELLVALVDRITVYEGGRIAVGFAFAWSTDAPGE